MLKRASKLALGLGLCAISAQAKQWYESYDFSQVSSQVVSLGDDTILRGKSVLMGQGKDQYSAYYDSGSMNLRFVAKGRINFNGTPWNGSHGGNSNIKSEVLLNSAPSLAWAYKSSWNDPRDFDYAPLPHHYVKFLGTYRHNEQVVFSYTVGDQKSAILEMPAMKDGAFVRHFNIAVAKEELLLKVLDSPEPSLQLNTTSMKLEKEGAIQFIRIPAGSKNLKFAISYKKGSPAPSLAAMDLKALTQGGKTRWPQTVKAQGKLNDFESDIFAVDQIPIPERNPWGSVMKFGGFDYFSDGSRAAFCTWNGDVWIASNLDKDLKNIVWKRYAAGMNETLGLRIVDDVIYVSGKDQITRLHDFNNDGEADFYENFNNDCKITKNFHEFTFDLHTDAAGNFYVAKAAPVLQGGRGFDKTHDNHGVIFKVSKDGQHSEIFASGLRAPGGMSINAEGTIATTGENEGTYVPACKINYLEKGDFAGVIHPGNGKKESEGYKKPLCFIPMNRDNSGGSQIWVPKNSWGDLGGKLIHLSYGQSKAYTTFQEKVNGQVQGGVVALPIRLMSSGMRIRFNPKNTDSAIITGFKGWQTNASRMSAINRVRYKGNKMIRPLEVKATTQGLYLTFNEMLDPETLKNVNNFSVQRWNYVYSEQYGSGHFATNTPQEELDKFKTTESKRVGRIGFSRNQEGEKVYVTALKLMRDGKTVFLKLHDMKPVDNMKVVYQLKTAKGKDLNSEIINTIYNLSPDDSQVPDMVSVKEMELQDKINNYPVGITVEMKGKHVWEYDNKVARLLNIQLKKDELPSPFLMSGAFTAIYNGHLIVTEKEKVHFQTELTGALRFELNGKVIFDENKNGELIKSSMIELDPGAHDLRLSFKSDTAKKSYFNLKWQGSKFPLEPISPNNLRYSTGATSDEFQSHRKGRMMIAEARCISCHKSESKELMPELAQMDSPSLENAGGRLHKSWMAEWIANPKNLNKHAHMPKVVLNKQEAKNIAEFLASDIQADKSAALTGNSKRGSELFYDLGCISCHTRPEEKNQKGERLLLSNVANKFKPQALKEFLMSPEKLYKWTKMPNFSLSDDEAIDLASFLLKRAKGPKMAEFKADAKVGHKLFRERGCIDCHGGKESSMLSTIPFEQIKGQQKGCLSRKPKINFGISRKEMEPIRKVFAQKAHSLKNHSPSEFAERQFKTLNCNACHSRDNASAKWQKYANEIKDLKTHYKDKGHLDQSRPQLTFVGEKIKEGTIKKYLDGSLDYDSREWLLARMPSFPARAEMMAKSLAYQHAQQGKKDSLNADKNIIAVGKKLVGTSGFGCIICHDIGKEKAIAAFEVKGVNLKYTADRLGKDFYMRWMLNPAHIVPNTKMPKYADEKGKSPLPDYNNDAAKQFEAIFEYINTLK
ncbi:probable large, multifunctional secreted protein [Lentisphaera araneosa HTCC2155]|uniref:Probable large, multifunctional secreted protein n=1 Tax=Lentisphaera araneosa HTCC2155 TaxID=313628 RepID=A6DLA9_9BACT|nr:cytochrome c [Lentisphaera araneosa]EDM27711.1 probable large, multifunctional secreted protein [Lentisphaera araneosa HTCC2155]